ncbi:MAG: GGDEF domain-containing protein [Eubacteriales bacterium]|nr:GGDEF domain-containing protein [Eubacteriales bacterium]
MFNSLLAANAILLALEGLLNVLNGQASQLARVLLPIAALILTLMQYQNIRRREIASLQLFPSLPIIASNLQILFFGISIVWLALSLALLLVYFEVQNNQIDTDHLTGLSNRRYFDQHLLQLIADNRIREIGCIMIDVNDFKKINDRYGHASGDEALEAIGGILKRALRKSDVITRLGGDEFAILMEISKVDDLTLAPERIRSQVESFNQANREPFTLSLSIGYSLYDRSSGLSSDDFIRIVDQKMLEDKMTSKSVPA